MQGIKNRIISQYSKYREFALQEIVWNDDAQEYVNRAYLPWAKEHYSSWMPECQQMPLGGTNNETVNAFLDRAGWGYQHADEGRDALISREMQQPIAQISDDIVLHRVSYEEECQRLQIKKGKEISIPYFWSTSLIKDYILAEYSNNPIRDTLITLYVPKGTRGIFIDFISHRFAEQEMLLDRDQTIRILWIDRDPKSKIKTHIYAVVSTT